MMGYGLFQGNYTSAKTVKAPVGRAGLRENGPKSLHVDVTHADYRSRVAFVKERAITRGDNSQVLSDLVASRSSVTICIGFGLGPLEVTSQ